MYAIRAGRSPNAISHLSGQTVTRALSATDMEPDEILDARGLLCPLPVLKAAKRLRAMTPGQILRVEADDPAAIVDVPHFCTETGYELLSSGVVDDVQIYLIQKT